MVPHTYMLNIPAPKHPAGRALNAEWSTKSLMMNHFETIYLSVRNDCSFCRVLM